MAKFKIPGAGLNTPDEIVEVENSSPCEAALIERYGQNWFFDRVLPLEYVQEWAGSAQRLETHDTVIAYPVV